MKKKIKCVVYLCELNEFVPKGFKKSINDFSGVDIYVFCVKSLLTGFVFQKEKINGLGRFNIEYVRSGVIENYVKGKFRISLLRYRDKPANW